jgi:hypothetical protein
VLWLVSRLLRSSGGSRRQRRSARRGSPRRPSRPQDRTAATTEYASVGLTFSWRNDQRNDQTPSSVRGPLIRQWSRRWSIWRFSAAISRSRGSRLSQVNSLTQRNRLRSRSPQVFFAASVWPDGRLHLRGGPLDSTNRADSQSTAHTGCRNRKPGAEATRYSS